jgi:hypothetical protein
MTRALPVRTSATPSDGDDLVNKTYADTLIDAGLAILSDTQDEAATAVSAAASATSSASAASAAQSAAEAALDSFDDRYLGAKSSAPVLDNDGDALVAGQIYYDTVTNKLRVYSGVAWADTVSTSAITAGSTDTLTNKTVDLTDNTVTGTVAEFDAACSDDNFLFASDVLDEDDFATDSETQPPSQQSVDAYLTANVARADAAQSLSDAYKQQARENIYAAPLDALAYHNIIINGGHRIDQENGGVAVTGISSYSFVTDQWAVGVGGAGVVTAQRVAEGVAGHKSSLKITVTTADASLAASDQCYVHQKIEQSRILPLDLGTSAATSSVICFWVRSSAARTIGVTLRNWSGSAVEYSHVSDVEITAPNTWEYKTIAIPAQTAGTWGASINAQAADIIFGLAVGTDRQGAAGWQSGNKIGTANTDNVLDTTSATIQFTGVTWLPGDVPVSEARSRFLQRHYDDELRQCQRYWFKRESFTAYVSAATSTMTEMIDFPVPMRAAPSMSGAASYQQNVSSISFNNATTLGARATIVSDAVGAAEWTGTVSLSARM